jgi:hypothetical protein
VRPVEFEPRPPMPTRSGERLYALVVALALNACGARIVTPTDASFVCPSDFQSLSGRPCSNAALWCGICGDAGPCAYCDEVRCDGTTWQRINVPPPAGCRDAGSSHRDSGSSVSDSGTAVSCGDAGVCAAGQACVHLQLMISPTPQSHCADFPSESCQQNPSCSCAAAMCAGLTCQSASSTEVSCDCPNC